MIEKESNKETFDFVRQVTNYLSDRFLQPLSAALLLSWSVWNYKIIMILISFDSIETKFKNVDLVHSGVVFSVISFQIESYWWYGFFLPVLSALLFIYVYPFAANHALEYTLGVQEKINIVKRKRSENELIDVARSRELVKENAQLKVLIDNFKAEFAEKEKNLVESINMLESNNARLQATVSSFESSSKDESAGLDINSKDQMTSSSFISNDDTSEYEGVNAVSHQRLVNSEKIRNSEYLWSRVENSVYSLEPDVKFSLSSIFESGVWSEYNNEQKDALKQIFEERVKNNKFINVKRYGVDVNTGDIVYITLPFSEYFDWTNIRDRVLLCLEKNRANKSVRGLMVDELASRLTLHIQIVNNCLKYLKEKGYVDSSQGSKNGVKVVFYEISSAGRLYIQAAGE